MTPILLGIVALVFALGLTRVTDLATTLRDVTARQNLLLRVLGFFVMSMWLHSLPSILVTIYMREQGFLSAELLEEDSTRAVVVSLYSVASLIALVVALCWGAFVAAVEKIDWHWRSEHSMGGYLLALALLGILYRGVGLGELALLAVISLPVAFYVTQVLTTPLEQQIQRYWIPFGVVVAITLALFWAPAVTARLVATQLRAFSTGGGLPAVVHLKERSFRGELILSTQSFIYMRLTDLGCLLRASAHEATLIVEPGQKRGPHGAAAPTLPKRDCDIHSAFVMPAPEGSRQQPDPAARTKGPGTAPAPASAALRGEQVRRDRLP